MRSHGRRAPITVALALLISLTGGLNNTTASAEPIYCVPLKSPTTFDSAWVAANYDPNENLINHAAAAGQIVQGIGRERFPDLFAGTRSLNGGNDLVISLTSCNESVFEQLIKYSGMDPSHIAVQLAPITEADLNKLFEETSKRVPELVKSGYRVNSVSVDETNSLVTIGVLNTTDTALESLADQFNGLRVKVQQESEADVFHAASRSNDNGYYRGGSFITGPSVDVNGNKFVSNGQVLYGDCTLGAATRAGNGGTYLVTAAHCFPLSNNDLIKNGSNNIRDSNNHSYGAMNSVGFVSNRDGSSAGIDAELIFGTGSGTTWVDYTITNSSRPNKGVAGYQSGDYVCHSGAFEGQICGFQSGIKGCRFIDYDPGTIYQCQGVPATSSNAQAVGEGDSGGPVMKFYPNSASVGGVDLYITGIVSASAYSLGGTAPNCTNWSPQASRRCGNVLLYTDFSAIQSKWGLTLLTQ